MSQPWLSVIMPTYNGAAYLDSALASIAAQPDRGVEVIAIDDGSTDETRAILTRYAHRMPLRVEARGRIGSWVANTNYGLRLARAEHACFLHQDDLWLPNRLRGLRTLLGTRPALLLHPCRFVNARGQCVGLTRCPLAAGPHASGCVMERLLVQNFITIPVPIFSRHAALDVGGLDEGLWYTADWDLWLKLAARGTSLYHMQPRTAYRVHAQSQTMQRGAARAAEMRRQLEVVLNRHLPLLQDRRRAREIGAAARLSVDLNHALAEAASGGTPPWWRFAWRFLTLGPSGRRRFLRDSRIVERVLSRIRARW
jgi:hypothetical protein